MAYIEGFRVSKLAGRESDVVRTLDRHVNVFWGLNGAGKTTLLKILHAALRNETTGLDALPFEHAEVVFRSSQDNTRFTRTYTKGDFVRSHLSDTGEVLVNGDLSLESPWAVEDDDESEEENWTTTAPGNPEPRRLAVPFRHVYLPITRVSDSGARDAYYRERGYYVGESPVTSDDVFVRQVYVRWSEYSTKSLSRIRDVHQNGLASVLAILFGGISDQKTREIDAVEPEEAYDLVRVFLHEQNIRLSLSKAAFTEKFKDSPDYLRVVAEIQEVRTEVGKILEPQTEFQRVIDGMYKGNKHLVLRRGAGQRGNPVSVEIGKKTIPLKSLSSGEKQLLQILLEALGAEEDSVMIDEPELSMHVDWQQRLVASLRRVNPACQLILATRSPEVMADVDDALVFEL